MISGLAVRPEAQRMSLVFTQVSLRGHGGEPPTGNLFFDLLGVQASDGFKAHPSDSAWRAALLNLVDVAIDDCLDAPEPSGEFAARICAGLKRAAEWLSDGREHGFSAWRQAGHKADIFVGGWLEENQFDFLFPPEFLLACGRLG